MELLLANDLKELERLTASLDAFAQENGLDSATAYKLSACLDELATNVFSYSGPRNPNEHTRISVDLEGGTLRVLMEDSGVPFNPLLTKEPDVSAGIEDREVGGLGIYLVKKMMDGVEYERQGNRNVLKMFKKLKNDPSKS